MSAYDPYGDNTEHGYRAREAIDGDPATYWNTEHYNGGLNKAGRRARASTRARRSS